MFLLSIETAKGMRTQRRVTPVKDSFTIGRNADSGILLKNSHFSKVHATLTSQGDDIWVVTDGDGSKPSENGLWIEGRRVRGSALLVEGQTLTLIDLLTDPDLAANSEDPIRATLKYLARKEIQASADVTLSGVGSADIAQMNQNLLKVLDESKALPEKYDNIADRLLKLETNQASAQMIDEILTRRYEAMASRIKKDKRFLLGIILITMFLRSIDKFTSESVNYWLDLATKILPFIALWHEIQSNKQSKIESKPSQTKSTP